MATIHTPTLFHHHNRPLRTILQESQIWFCARDLGRLMSRPLSERTTRKLDEDQRRTVLLADHGEASAELMVTESAVYALLAQHYHIDNRGLRRWISNEVVASIRDGALPVDCVQPSLSFLQWPGLSVSLLHWQSEPWIRLRDMPRMLPYASEYERPQSKRGKPWWKAAWEVLRFT
jgi:prophage antirepressor-like protein